MRRPIRARVWFWKPCWYWHGWTTLIPFFRGGDEYDWHTIGFGWTVTGRVIIATRRCPQTGRCDPARNDDYELAPDWPVGGYAYLEESHE